MKKIIVIIAVLSQILIASMELVSEIAEHDTFRVIVPLGGDTVSTGTGFIINKDGYLITNNHVVEGSQGVFLLKNNFDTYKDVTLVKTYPKHDIAILKINNYIKGEFLKLQKPSTIKKGLSIFPLGFPAGADISGVTFNATLSAGIISKIDVVTEDKYPPNYKFVQIDAAINHGNSGGPLLSKNGTVVGINTLGKKDTQGIFWAVHVEELMKVLKENSIAYTIDDSDIGQADNMKKVWTILAIFAVIMAIVLFFIIKHKKAPTKLDEREVSKLVRDKMKKYANNNVQEENNIIESDTPINETRMMSVVLISTNTTLPEINNMYKQEVTVGRSSECDIVINNFTVSSRHLKLNMQGSIVEVTDLGSTNGTYIDGQKLTANKKYILEAEQKLVVGGEDVVYSIKSSQNLNNNETILICENSRYQNITKVGTLGRDKNCDTVIDNSNVSRQHLKIEKTNGNVFITDLGSANGTFIDGKKLKLNEKMLFLIGSNLVVGSEELVYHLSDT